MIALLTEADRGDFLGICDGDMAYGAEIRTFLAVYGIGARDCDFWLARDGSGAPAAAICRENGRVFLSLGPGANPGELLSFLQVIGGFGRICAQADLCGRLQSMGSLYTASVMRYTGGASGESPGGIVQPSLEELYGLLRRVFREMDPAARDRWYVYHSHLFRHGLGMAAGVRVHGELAGTGGVYAMGPRTGTIACVATDPAHRGRGYAARIVRRLCDFLQENGRQPVLLCAGDHLVPYYRELGFEVCGRWGKVDRPPRARQ